MSLSRLAVLIVGVGLLPGVAEACSVCFSATEQSRTAFIVTTVFLSVLPLAMVGGGVVWLRLRIRRIAAEAAEVAEREIAPAEGLS